MNVPQTNNSPGLETCSAPLAVPGAWDIRAGRALTKILALIVLAFLLLAPCAASGEAGTEASDAAPGGFHFNVGFDGANGLEDVDVGIKILLAITLLSMAPSIILLMTSFMRIVIVLSFVRSALSLQATPATQIIVGLSLFLTYFIMEPVWSRIDSQALQPYMAKQITSEQAMEEAARPIRTFMLRQTRPKDLELFVGLARLDPTPPEKMPLRVVIPSFIISELRTAFQMGFLIFVPFLLIDLVVATVLMSMGMMMMPPATVALPLKILLFVLVDGWELIVRSLIMSFGG
jgi:flagellar biosynthesis protein FliP